MGKFSINRRGFIGVSSAFTLSNFVAPYLLRAQGKADRKLLFVIAAGGGASIMDSLLPVLSTEAGGGIHSFTPEQVASPQGSAFRCPIPIADNTIQGAVPFGSGYPIANFLTKHTADTVVMTNEVSSVNHNIAAKRAITGNNVNAGRTLMEAVAAKYGKDIILPNCNMAGGGYGEQGIDASLDAHFRGSAISDPLSFAFALDSTRGILGAPDKKMLSEALKIRLELEKSTDFAKTFGYSPLLQEYVESREAFAKAISKGDLIDKLMLLQSSGNVDLSKFGLQTSKDMEQILSKFPDVATDPFQAQAALGFLLAKHSVSTAITITPGASPVFKGDDNRVVNAPIGFDFSHQDHRGTQNAMWSRVFETADSLIDLLKAQDMDGDPAKGKMWDHSLIYIATEFGRDKTGGSSGHHLNNGNVMISPLLKGNTIFGGIDPQTGLTYGFNPVTGEPDQGINLNETHVYSAVCQALGVDFKDRQNMSAMMKA